MDRANILTFCREKARSLLISSLIGVVVAGLYAAGRNTGRVWPMLVVGALVGISIWLFTEALDWIFRPWLTRVPERGRIYAHGLLFLVGGTSGWVAGVLLGTRLFGQKMHLTDLLDKAAVSIMVATGGISVAMGLIFRTIELMRSRLEETTTRLKEREWAEKELELARLIQKRLLPPEQIEGTAFAISARNLPAHLVAGDFYDVVQLDDGSVVIVVADVAGKGMGASLIMASVKAVLPFVARQPVGEAVAILNQKLVQELGRREFVALTFARYFPSDGTLHLVNAGCPDPYLLRNGSVEALTVQGARLPLGLRSDVQYQTLTTHIGTRDRVLFVSDGIPEAPGAGDEPLGYDGMVDLVRTTEGVGGARWLDAFLDGVRGRVQSPLSDDWTALLLDVR